MEKELLARIGNYLTRRSLNPRKITRKWHKENGDVISLHEAIVICSMILSGELEQFFDRYDSMSPERLRTTTRVVEGRFGKVTITAPPSSELPDFDYELIPPDGGSGVPGERRFPGHRNPMPPPEKKDETR